jgi:AraC-like DNA-binding protein
VEGAIGCYGGRGLALTMDPTLVTPDMRYWRIAPDPRLRSHVLCYYLARPSEGSRQVGAEPPREEELLLPDGHSEVVFGLGGAFERWQLGQTTRSIMRRSYLIGGRSFSVLTRDLGPVAVAGIKLDPRALRQLIRLPLGELKDTTLTLQELGQRGLLGLEDAVANAPSAPEVAAVFDRYLLRALSDVPPAEAAVEQLLQQIRRSRGALSIMEWVRKRGVDARHLERRFADGVGMTPKRYARIVRFKHGYHALLAAAAAPPTSRRAVAAARLHLDGFYDQSHFNKEFRAFIGGSPSAHLSAALLQTTSISDHLLAGELAAPPFGAAGV